MSRIRQERLSSKEHMRAVLHSLELLDIELTPCTAYKAADPAKATHRAYHNKRPYIYQEEDGNGQWVDLQDTGDQVRIVLNPDEGGPLFSSFQFMAAKSAPIAFRRDELSLVCIDTQTSVKLPRSACAVLLANHLIKYSTESQSELSFLESHTCDSWTQATHGLIYDNSIQDVNINIYIAKACMR